MPVAVVVAFAAVTVAVVLQQIDVPRQMLDRISPATVSLLTQYDVLFAATAAARSHALSVDPGRTWTGLLLLISLGTLCLGLTGTLNERLIVRIVRAIVVLGLAVYTKLADVRTFGQISNLLMFAVALLLVAVYLLVWEITLRLIARSDD